MLSNNRVYRSIEPSDLVRISEGSLKAYYCSGHDKYLPAKLVSTRINKAPFWIVDNGETDHWLGGFDGVVVDVTPEKRYAVWSHTIQRFLYTNNDAGFASKTAAECFMRDSKNCYVVEWEIKDNV